MRTKAELAALKDDLAKLNGKPPYNSPANFCWNDNYFARHIVSKYGASLNELEKELVQSIATNPSLCPRCQRRPPSIPFRIGNAKGTICRQCAAEILTELPRRKRKKR